MKGILRKTRILFWAQLPPPLHGASLRNKAIFESELIREHFHLIYLPFNYSNSIEELGKFSFRKSLLFFKLYVTLIFKCILREFDLVYFTYSLRRNGVLRDSLFVILFRLFNVPIIYHFRNKGAKELSSKPVLNKLMTYCFKKGDFICLSRIAVSDVEKFIDKNNLYIVNNGIEPFEGELVNSHSYDDSFNLFFISNLRHEKGVYTLLKTYSQLQKIAEQKFSLSIVGQEGDITYTEIEDYIKEHQLHNVKLLGPIYGKEKYNLYKNSDLFLFPTRNEVFPGVILEAMQFGLPIVTTNVGSIPDIIKHGYNGMICDVDDFNTLAKTVKRLMEDSELRSHLKVNAKKDFFDNYTLASFEEKMLQTFKSIESNYEF